MTLTRREFGKLAATAAAAGMLPQAKAEEKPIGWCIVALGRISMQHFMPGMLQSKTGRIVALVSGHRPKAEQQAAQYGVPDSAIYDYENYDRIAENKSIDAVYIALPNGMHAEYTIRAAKAGKHVLCEKPMATSVADCQAMIDACHAAKRKLMIAYRCQYEPVNLKAIALIRSGAIGSVQAFESANGFNIGKGEWRLTRKLGGGGPLMDVGIYSLNASRYLTGEEPGDIQANASVIDHDGRFTEVEENVGWTMRFPSGIVASCNTSYGSDMDGFYRVHGSKGMIELSPAFGYEGIHLRAQMWGQPAIDMPSPQLGYEQFTVQADYFANCIRNDREPKSDGEEGLRDMTYMKQIYKAAGLTRL
jgi:predicted dehydrogenase